MSKNQICTPFELKQFAFSLAGDNPTALNFARFIESKSGFKYTVIEIEFLTDTLRALEEYVKFASILNKTFKEKWEDLGISMIK